MMSAWINRSHGSNSKAFEEEADEMMRDSRAEIDLCISTHNSKMDKVLIILETKLTNDEPPESDIQELLQAQRDVLNNLIALRNAQRQEFSLDIDDFYPTAQAILDERPELFTKWATKVLKSAKKTAAQDAELIQTIGDAKALLKGIRQLMHA